MNPTPQKADRRLPSPSLAAAAESVAKVGRVAWYAVGVIVAVFLGGVGAQEYRSGLVDDQSLEKRLMPVEFQVRQNTDELTRRARIVDSVDQLLERDKKEDRRQKERRKLSVYDREYSQSLAEYSADKAANKAVHRPRKSPAHIEQEAVVEEFDK